MPRIASIVEHYSPYRGYVWEIDLGVTRLVCSATTFTSGDPHDTGIRCCDAVLGCLGDLHPRIYDSLDELLSHLPPLIRAIHVYDLSGEKIRSFYRVKKLG